MKNVFLFAAALIVLLFPFTSYGEILVPEVIDLSGIDEALLPIDDSLFANEAALAVASTPSVFQRELLIHNVSFQDSGIEEGPGKYLVRWNTGVPEDFDPYSFMVSPFESFLADYANNVDFANIRVNWDWLPVEGLWNSDLDDYSRLGSDLEDLPANRDPAFAEMAWRSNYLNGMHFFMVGLLAMAPNDFTNWDDESKTLSGAADRWRENVKTGPVSDEDDGSLNWVAHPWMGSGYYVMARHAGMKKWDSFLYSAFASTFLWEYGIEAIAEVPSKQDLLITPILGSLAGEWALRTEAWIKKNDRKCWHSKKLGGIVLWLLNPFHIITSAMAHDFNRIMPGQWKTEFFRDVQVYPEGLLSDAAIYERNMEREEIWGLRWKSRF
jgi:hypothetical protein